MRLQFHQLTPSSWNMTEKLVNTSWRDLFKANYNNWLWDEKSIYPEAAKSVLFITNDKL